MLTWTKNGKDAFKSVAGPFTIEVSAKGDGRWNWHVTRESRAPEAAGLARSLGAAKSVSEQYVMRTGVL